MERARCLIAVPYRDVIQPACEGALRELTARGYTVLRDGGADPIDHKRSRMATTALLDERFEEILWIDADMDFQPDAADRLRGLALPLVGAMCARRNQPEFAFRGLPDAPPIPFGQAGGAVEVLYVGTGFLLTHRRLYEAIARAGDLPWCTSAGGELVVPYFLPIVHWDAEYGTDAYLGEDYSFCERARRAGHKVFVDTSLRIGHIGGYPYSWEDMAPRPKLAGGVVELRRR